MNPHVEAAERVLGKAATNPTFLRRVVEDVREVAFPTPETLAVFQTFRKLALEGIPLEAATVIPQLPGSDSQRAALVPLVFAAFEEPTPLAGEYWLGKLLEHQRERSLGDLLLRCDTIRNGPDAWAVREERIVGLLRQWAVNKEQALAGLISLSDLLAETALTGWARSVRSGVAAWDTLIGGFAPGSIHVLAGRPGSGKTTLTLRMADAASREGATVLLFPLEMGEHTTAEWCSAMGVTPESKLVFARAQDRRWPSVRKWLDAAGEAYRPALVILDHLGHLAWERSSGNRNRALEIGEILRDLRQAVRSRSMAALVVCQLNRAVEGRRSAQPMLADLRESGEIEQEADSVTFLWSDPKDRTKADVPTWLSVGKNRFGPLADVPLSFHRPTRMFRDREP